MIICLLLFVVYQLFKYIFQSNIILGVILLVILGSTIYHLFKSKIKEDFIENTIHLDSKGYERDSNNNLIHRNVAYEFIYKDGYVDGVYTDKFRNYDVHHIDKNKRNNSPGNLKILTREEHKAIHGH